MAKKKPAYTRRIVLLGEDMQFGLREGMVFEFTLPSGKTGRWEALHRSLKPTVLMAGFTEEMKLILVRQFRFGVEDYTYELPGGNIEPGENAQEAVRREFLEETGYATDSLFEKIAEGWLYNSGVNTSFIVYYAIGCRKICDLRRGEVERHTNMTVVEQSIFKVAGEIAKGNRAYDPPISHALVALVAQRKVNPFSLVPEYMA